MSPGAAWTAIASVIPLRAAGVSHWAQRHRGGGEDTGSKNGATEQTGTGDARTPAHDSTRARLRCASEDESRGMHKPRSATLVHSSRFCSSLRRPFRPAPRRMRVLTCGTFFSVVLRCLRCFVFEIRSPASPICSNPMTVSRRTFLTASAASIATASASPSGRRASAIPIRASRSSIPPSRAYRINSAKVERIATGMRWAEGPVWFGDGRYLLWSDIPNNRIMKWDEETGAVSVFRKPSNNSPTATRATARAGCSPASTTRGASPAPSTTARSR